MKIITVTGSRSDRNAIAVLTDALRGAGHDVEMVSVGPQWSVYVAPTTRTYVAIADVEDRIIGAGFKPDLLFLHGDRHEILGAAVAANVLGIPIAHIGGGDLTEGSQDDCFRHAITKLSHLHFASNQDSADRIVQMGEEPDRVHVTGCPGIDMVMATPTLGWDETLRAVGWEPLDGPRKVILVLFHSNTLGDTASELKSLSDALMARTEALVLLGPNADAGSDLIRREWQRLAQNRPDTVYHDNVEPQVFYSLLKWCDVLVGNSSAGLYEAPCFGISVLNLGKRQEGRPVANNIITYTDFDPAIIDSLIDGAPTGRDNVPNPYGDGHSCERIVKVLETLPPPATLLRKQFYPS